MAGLYVYRQPASLPDIDYYKLILSMLIEQDNIAIRIAGYKTARSA
jgi:hypothetical protein